MLFSPLIPVVQGQKTGFSRRIQPRIMEADTSPALEHSGRLSGSSSCQAPEVCSTFKSDQPNGALTTFSNVRYLIKYQLCNYGLFGIGRRSRQHPRFVLARLTVYMSLINVANTYTCTAFVKHPDTSQVAACYHLSHSFAVAVQRWTARFASSSNASSSVKHV